MALSHVALRFWPIAVVVVAFVRSALSVRPDVVVKQQWVANEVVRLQHALARNITQLLFDEANGQVVAAGRDVLLRLDVASLQLMEASEWGASAAAVRACTTKGQSADDCHNHITLLQRDGRDGNLLVCGTHAFAPMCRRYAPTDLRVALGPEESGEARAPYSPRHNSTAIVASNGNVFLGSRIDFGGNDPAIVRSGQGPTLRTPQWMPEYLSDPQFVASFEIGPFVYMFFRESAVEFMRCGRATFSRVARVCRDDAGGRGAHFRRNWTTFLKARLNCSLPGASPFYFNELQGVAYAEAVHTFYITFTTEENSIYGSAVCAYSLESVDLTFRGPLTGKSTDWHRGRLADDRFRCMWSGKDSANRLGDAVATPAVAAAASPVESADPGGNSATSSAEQLSHNTLLDLKRYQQTYNAVEAVQPRPLYLAERERFVHLQVDVVSVTSAAFSSAERKDENSQRASRRVARGVAPAANVAQTLFVLTLENVLKKFVIIERRSFRNNRSGLADDDRFVTCVVEVTRPFRVGERVSRLLLVRDTYRNDGGFGNGALIAATDSGVLRIPLAMCGRHRSRVACLAAGDPHCGWNTLTERCTPVPPASSSPPAWWQQSQPCVGEHRPLDGGWSAWPSRWELCDFVTAHQGQTSSSPTPELAAAAADDRVCLCRRRRCDSPKPLNGGRPCSGSDTQVTNCTQHGGWTDWGRWSACSVSCGRGHQQRSRSCSNPKPLHGGRPCSGLERERRACPRNPPCSVRWPDATTVTSIGRPYEPLAHPPATAEWGEWSEWTPCSARCGVGFQLRRRNCSTSGARDVSPDAVVPTGCHPALVGCMREFRTCNSHECPETRSAAHWTPWLGVVNKSLAEYNSERYLERRTRYQCIGRVAHSSQIRLIAKEDLRVCYRVNASKAYLPDGRHTTATSATHCTEPPVHMAVTGSTLEDRMGSANNDIVVVNNVRGRMADDPFVTHHTVDDGELHRLDADMLNQRQHDEPHSSLRSYTDMLDQSASADASNSYHIVGNRDTDASVAWSAWGSWGPCSVTCGAGGVQRRKRVCVVHAPPGEGSTCAGISMERRRCGSAYKCANDTTFDSDGTSSAAAVAAQLRWTEWSAWSDCDERGEQHRRRLCVASAGRRCVGPAAVSQTRESRACRQDRTAPLTAAGVARCATGGIGGGSGVEAAGALAVTTVTAAIAYLLGLLSTLLAVRLYGQRKHHDERDCDHLRRHLDIRRPAGGGGAMFARVVPNVPAHVAAPGLQAAPLPKRLGSLPLLPVEGNTYVPTSTFRRSGNPVAADQLISSHTGTITRPPTRTATIKRSTTFRAQINDDHSF